MNLLCYEKKSIFNAENQTTLVLHEPNPIVHTKLFTQYNTHMKTKQILLMGLLSLSTTGFAQLDSFEVTLAPMFSQPEQDGWMYFNTPNSYQPGACFAYYKTERNDTQNDMLLLDVHVDSLAFYKHYKFQQLFKGVPVEGAGCIEHFDPIGNLIFTNAKHAIDIQVDVVPTYDAQQIMDLLLEQLPPSNHYAWEHPLWEQQIQEDQQDPNATWYPVPELMLGVDAMKDMHADIPGSRYRLAYKIRVTTITPTIETTDYYIDAHTAEIFRVQDGHIYDGPADIFGYGSRIIDTRWEGGFTQKHVLFTDNETRNIHTKKYSNIAWGLRPEIKDADDDWGSNDQEETSAHYHASNAWDYYKDVFGRTGQNNEGREIRVSTQLNDVNAYFGFEGSYNRLTFGETANGAPYGNEPSVVAHEFTHGVIHHSSNLAYSYESGAINESYADIFGIVIHAMMLDGGTTDWLYGNFVSNSNQHIRSLKDPKLWGEHIENNALVIGQPDTYESTFWYDGDLDYGGVHINSGVQNHWFYILSAGESGVNDIGNFYNVSGIGMTKAARIAYYAVTSVLGNASQYVDSRYATTQAAAILYGYCSLEYQRTIDAWHAVGLGFANDCTFTASVSDLNMDDLLVYPNPATSELNIELPATLVSSAKIYDLAGRLVLEQESTSLSFKIDVNSLESGTYSIAFEFDGGMLTKRFVVL